MAKQTLEEGDVFFLYRPTVDVARVNGLADVFTELGMERDLQPLEPLCTGERE